MMTTLLLRLLAGVVVLSAFAAGVVGLLVVAFDLQIEFAGNGFRPLFSFGAPDAHYAALEADRGSRELEAAPEPAAEDAPDGEAYWTDFRGPRRDGLYNETAIRTEWPGTGLEPLWNQPVGGGYASFVIAGGRAFTIEQRRNEEVVAAYDVDTGVEVWTYAWSAHFQETMGGAGPRATPTWHDGRLYALGANGRFVCLDADTGALVWQRDILADGGAANLPWAMSGAPLVVDDLVVVQPGGARGWSVAAYERLTGDVVWHVLDDVQAYTSPMLATLGGRPADRGGHRRTGRRPAPGRRDAAVGVCLDRADRAQHRAAAGGRRRASVSLGRLRQGRGARRADPGRRPLHRSDGLGDQPDEEQVQQLRADRRLHLRTRRIDSRLHRRRHRRADVEGRAATATDSSWPPATISSC